jgi:hypothetical protein
MGKRIIVRDRSSGKQNRFDVEVGGAGTNTALEVASGAEAVTGTSTTALITPSALTDATASAIATATPIMFAKLYVISFTGKNNTGACTATGTAVSDVVLGVAGISTVGKASTYFEAVVTVVDQIQQSSASDLSTKSYTALIYRPS